MIRFLCCLGMLGIGMLMVIRAEAGAKKPATPSCPVPGTPGFTTPYPVRRVVMKPVATKVFRLPNGGSADLSFDLNSILNTVVASSSNLSPADPTSENPCQSYIEIRSAVTTFQLDIAEVGVSIGYTPSGELGPIAGINGKVNTKIGLIAMDFSVWQCTLGTCSAVAASTANHLTAGVNLAFEIDFGMVQTGPSLVFNTPLGPIVRKIMENGIQQINSSARLNELAWSARVREYTPEIGSLIFDAGLQARVQPNQTFEIYAPTDSSSSGSCYVYKVVSHVHTTSVGTVSSTALVDKIFDSRGVQPGDIVMIRKADGK